MSQSSSPQVTLWESSEDAKRRGRTRLVEDSTPRGLDGGRREKLSRSGVRTCTNVAFSEHLELRQLSNLSGPHKSRRRHNDEDEWANCPHLSALQPSHCLARDRSQDQSLAKWPQFETQIMKLRGSQSTPGTCQVQHPKVRHLTSSHSLLP